MNPLGVDVVILNYNSIKDTLSCLESLKNQKVNPEKIIIVDNKSTDDSCEEFFRSMKNYQHAGEDDKCEIFTYKGAVSQVYMYDIAGVPVHFILSNINGGYAYGNNLGVSYSNHISDNELVLILNPDVVLSNDTIAILKNEYRNEKEKGETVKVIGVQLNYYDEPNRVQAIGGKFNKYLGICRHVGAHLDVDNIDFHTESKIVDYPIGACILIEKECFNQLTGFSECYFLYYEEIDFVTRAARLGFKFKIINTTSVLHKEGGSIGSSSKSNHLVSVISDKYILSSRLIFIRKFYPQYLLPSLLVHAYYIIKRVYYGEWKKVKNALLALKVLGKKYE